MDQITFDELVKIIAERLRNMTDGNDVARIFNSEFAKENELLTYDGDETYTLLK